MRSGYQFSNTWYPAWDYFHPVSCSRGNNTKPLWSCKEEIWWWNLMSQCTDRAETRACYSPAACGERDAGAGPECPDVPRAVGQAVGEQGWWAARPCLAGRGLWRDKAKAKCDWEASQSWELLLTLLPPFLPSVPPPLTRPAFTGEQCKTMPFLAQADKTAISFPNAVAGTLPALPGWWRDADLSGNLI